MKPVQATFTTGLGDESVRLTYVPDYGVNAELGTMEEDVFVPQREDQFEFTDHPELVGMFAGGGWNMEVVIGFIFGTLPDSDDEVTRELPHDTAKEVDKFNQWLKTLTRRQ